MLVKVFAEHRLQNEHRCSGAGFYANDPAESKKLNDDWIGLMWGRA